MTAAGIDTSVYKCRAKDIIGAAGWTKEGTFHRFYNANILSNFNFCYALLHAGV